MSQRAVLIGILALLGAGWGLTQPLAKIAVSEGYRHFGLIFWQFVVGAMVMSVLTTIRRRGLPYGLPQIRIYVIIALIGTLIPNSASYEAVRFLPAGIISILMSLMPMFAFPIALAFGIDRFNWWRLGGLALGLGGVSLLVLPDASLPDAALVAFIPLAIIAPVFYGLEANVVAKWGTAGCDAVQVLLGASVVGAILTAPLALFSGQWIDPRPPWGTPDAALVLSSVIHVFAYSTYVWLVVRAGSVFAAQTSYLVTAFGLLWAMLILSESYSGWIWAALALIFAGMVLVQPRARAPALDAAGTVGEDAH